MPAAALGREVKVRAKGERCVVEMELDSPSEGIELAQNLLRSEARAAA